MPYYDEVDLQDVSRKTACDLGEVIRKSVPEAYQLTVLSAVLDHIETQLKDSNGYKISRSIEAGLVSGLGGGILKRTIGDAGAESDCQLDGG